MAKSLNMLVNMNQKYTGFPASIQSSGCPLCCGVNVSSYQGTSKNNTMPYFIENYWGSNGYSWQAPNTTFNDLSYSLTNIKNEIDAGRPVIVKAAYTRSNNTEHAHWVTVYGYEGSCTSASQVLVLDSANPNESSSPIGARRNLPEAMNFSLGSSSGWGYKYMKKCTAK